MRAEWIRVSVELPNPGVKVLVWVKDWRYEDFMVTVGYFIWQDRWCIDGVSGHGVPAPTHWAHLPAGPIEV